ncbi:MAG TPA: ribonuclease J [Ktedonobacterales bacterium]
MGTPDTNGTDGRRAHAETRPRRESAVRIVPLGGVGEVGKNATVVEYGQDLVLVDVGVKFPEEEQHGVDLVIPDLSYVRERVSRLRGILLTHGHEDHIGGLPYALPQLATSGKPIPLYGSALTLGLVRAKLQEHRAQRYAEFHVVEPHTHYRLSKQLEVEFIPVAHSIPGSYMVAIQAPVGTVIITGDYKLDPTPGFGPPTDVDRLQALGDAGVLALLSDCVRIERPGRTPSEQVVAAAIDRWIAQAPARALLTTFASNIPRLEFAIRAAHRYGRQVAVVGCSMEQSLQVAQDLGYVSLPSDVLITADEANRLPPRQVLLLTTGSQGEPSSALARIAAGTHPRIQLREHDTVILSATPIPGNDDTVARTLDNLFRAGAQVIYSAIDPGVHVSGHASRDELREVLGLVRPRFVAPIHGEYRHQALYATMAGEAGYSAERILLADLGQVLEFSPTTARRKGKVPSGAVLVDGLTVGSVSRDVLRDREHLASDGLVVATLIVDRETGALLAEPEIVARGVAQFEDLHDGDILGEATRRLRRTVRQVHGQIEYGELVERAKETLGTYIWKRLHLRPLILPVVTAV